MNKKEKIRGSINPILYLFTKMWRYSEGNRSVVRKFWLMFVCAAMVDLMLEPYILSRVLNTIQQDGINPTSIGTLFILLILYFVVDFLFWTFHGPARVMECNNAFSLRLNYRKFFLSGVMHLPMQWHVDHHSGDTIDKIEKGTSALYMFSEETFELLYSFIRLLICYSILVYFSPVMGLIALFFLVLSVFITIRIDTVLVENYKELSRKENEAAQSILEAISNITTVVILRVEKYVYDSVVHIVESQFKLTKSTNALAEFKWFMTSMMCRLMTVTVLAYYFWKQSSTGAVVVIGTVYLLLSYLGKINDVFFRFTSLYSNLVKWKVRTENAEILSVDFRDREFGKHGLPKNWSEISISGLDFTYPNSKESQLKEINLSLRRGSKIALIGESGSGKTTFLKIVRGLFDPNNVEIQVDGNKVKEGFLSFGESVALIPQDPEIFQNTIRYNLTMGAEFTDSQISKAIEVSRFDDVMPSLPKGLDSSIKEKGVNLSGGQKQRLALARGILASFEKDVVLLDEPTSSLDAVNEKIVYERLLDAFKGKLVVSSLHKLYLLPLFDHIVVFENGKIVAQGDLQTLHQTSLHFKKMWETHQFN